MSVVSESWPWLTLALLGAYHGLNPAMGWLFAVALGLQEQRRGAVLQALPPIALGHAVAITLAVLIIGAAQIVIPLDILSYVFGSVLILFGLYKLVRRKHPRWVGMRVGFGDLTLWSFLMASAHGAGLMLIPILLSLSSAGQMEGVHDHSAHMDETLTGTATVLTDLGAVVLHTLAMFAVMGAVAILVYEKLGVMILKRTWINVDLLWAGALVAAGVITLVI
jgi:uncharacterized membrane protein